VGGGDGWDRIKLAEVKSVSHGKFSALNPVATTLPG